MDTFGINSEFGLEQHGITSSGMVYWNPSKPVLVERIIRNNEGFLTSFGAVVAYTGKFCGRSPGDKYVIQCQDASDEDIWWGKVNQPLSEKHFDGLLHKMRAYMSTRDIYIQDMLAGSHPKHNMPIRIITEKAWHSLFAQNLFVRVPHAKLPNHKPEFVVLHCPDFFAIPEEDGTRTGAFIIINFKRRMVLIGGTAYAGEIKKSIFSVMNYLLPKQNILSMHCSANVGKHGDTALFFGLSGTGKTTLSSEPERRLIGDDEHGWSDDSVFNIEGGCYAKTIRLSHKYEPIIWDATHHFGTIIENVPINELTHEPFFDDASLTENTRAAYPIENVAHHVTKGYGNIPDNIFFLTADAFGVLPPLAKLDQNQAMYYFLCGYTSKIAGTEDGLGKEPQATFSACFGLPFLPLHPFRYAELLRKKLEAHHVQIWLVNTGWSGGPYGIGSRIQIPFTRAMVRAALNNQLDGVPLRKDNLFNLWIPESCPDVPSEILDPGKNWVNPFAYRDQANRLITRFHDNFAEYKEYVPDAVQAGGPIGA